MNDKYTMKKHLSGALALFFILLMLLPQKALAADVLWDSYEMPSSRQKERLLDEADLLSDSEEKALLSKLNELSNTHQCNVAVLTVDAHNGPIQDYADDYFDYNGFQADFGGSGILFMLSMEEREWAISTHGSAIDAFTDYGQHYMVDCMMGALGSGEYAEAFDEYVSVSDYLLSLYEQGTPYDEGYEPPKTAGDYIRNLIFSIIIGLVVALIPIFFMAGELKTVKMASGATNYDSGKGISLTSQEDRFERKVLNKTPIPKNDNSRSGGGFSGGGSSTHTSSSGSTHGGSHGHF